MTFLKHVVDPSQIITAIDSATRFPEIMNVCKLKYASDIERFKSLITISTSSADLLDRIRQKSYTGEERMSLLKMFRRCVSPVIDTEMAKKITKVSTATLVATLGHTFKPIALLQTQFAAITSDEEAALAALIGEYDTRGQLGYLLTASFFDWFELSFRGQFLLEGPRGAGRDVELSTVLDGFVGSFPCDFIIRRADTREVRAIGFARYDSTRGGAQSDDRTGGNSDKVNKVREFFNAGVGSIKVIFLADGPGLAHRDTWEEAVKLDDSWNGNVRVCTLKTALPQITALWLNS